MLSRLLKSTIKKIVGGDKEERSWLKKLLIGGALLTAVGLNVLLSYLGDLPKKMTEMGDNISGIISDFIKKITGQFDETEEVLRVNLKQERRI